MSADIKVGDLIKATSKDNPEQTFTGRVGAIGGDWFAVPTAGSLSFRYWDLEVLDRPLPPVEEELLKEAKRAYYDRVLEGRDQSIRAVINTVREFDKSKENSK